MLDLIFNKLRIVMWGKLSFIIRKNDISVTFTYVMLLL